MSTSSPNCGNTDVFSFLDEMNCLKKKFSCFFSSFGAIKEKMHYCLFLVLSGEPDAFVFFLFPALESKVTVW